jgi:ATPase subunit of ABC transporter with duplicated ATPase domains
LEEALEDFKGTIFFISHDRYFINKVSERVIEIEDKGFKTYLGNYDYYKSKKDEQSAPKLEEPKIVKEKVKKPINIEEGKKREAELAKVEAKIIELEAELKEVESAMVEAGSNYEELNRLYSLKEDLSKELESVMRQWVSFNENNI